MYLIRLSQSPTSQWSFAFPTRLLQLDLCARLVINGRKETMQSFKKSPFVYSCFEKGCRGKAYATMSKVIIGNGGFYSYLSEPQGVSAWWKETAQSRIRSFSFLVAESPWTSIKQSLALTTHSAYRHCRVCFYTFVGQPLSKQLLTRALTETTMLIEAC